MIAHFIVKLSAILSVLFVIPCAQAANGDMNRFECVYGRPAPGQPWQLIESIFEPANYHLPPAQVLQGFAGWTNEPGEVNYAVCSSMTATTDPDRVIVNTSVYKGKWFDPVTSCDVTGEGLELVQFKRDELLRGQSAVVRFPWKGVYRRMALRVHYPTVREVAVDIPGAADRVCSRAP